MLKEHGLSPEPTFGVFELPPKPNKTTDYAYGTTAINGNVGERDRIWTFKYANGTINVINENGIAVELVSGTYATELAGAFDINMHPVVVWVNAGVTRLYRFDYDLNDFITEELGTGFVTPRLTFDQRNLKFSNRRTYLTYIKDNGLYIRTSDDDYQTEELLGLFEKEYKIEQFGLSIINRLQYRLYRLVMPEDLIEGDEVIVWTKSIINASYDPLTQTIECIGEAGDVFETYSSEGVLIGTGTIGQNGTVTYPIDETTLTNGEELTTIVVDKPNEFTHIYSGVSVPFTYKINPIDDSSQGATINVELDTGLEPVNYTIDWGDGTTQSGTIPAEDYDEFSHFYSTDGIYTVQISFDNKLTYLFANNATEVVAWGTGKFDQVVLESPVLTKVPNVLPTYVRSLGSTFRGCRIFNQNISMWDTSRILDMSSTFQDCEEYNQPLGPWDVGSVSSMRWMFGNTYVFNQDLTSWCVSLISSEPFNFAYNSALQESNKPVWGTCPTAVTQDIEYALLPYSVAKLMSSLSNPPLNSELADRLNPTTVTDPVTGVVTYSFDHDLNYPFTLVGLDGQFYSQPIIIKGFVRIKGGLYQDLMTRYNAGSNTTALEITFGAGVNPIPVQALGGTGMGGIHAGNEMYLELFPRWPIFVNAGLTFTGGDTVRWKWLDEQGNVVFDKELRTENNINFFKLQNNFEESVQTKEILFDRTFTSTYFPYYRLLSNPYTFATNIDSTNPFDTFVLDNSVAATLLQDTNKLSLNQLTDSEDFVIQFWMPDKGDGDINIISGHIHEKQVYTNGIMFTIFIPKYVPPAPVCTPTVLDMLTDTIPDVGSPYQYSYRVNGGPIQTNSENAGGNPAQPVMVNILGYYGFFPTLVDNGSHPGPRAFLAEYGSPIRGVGTDDPNLVTTETNTIEFLLTDGAQYDLIQTVFGGPITLYSCGTANFTN